MQPDLSAIPRHIKEAIIAEHLRDRMAALGRKSSAAKRAAARKTIAKVNQAKRTQAEKRLAKVRRAIARGISLTAACKDAGVNYSRAKDALGL